MLHPKNNRIDYGEQLIPPEGYELAYAVGTSYSLDLEALLILPVALFYAQNLDGSADELRYDMLDALTRAAEKITVYYQNGQLKVPQKYHYLMAYWEKGIHPVTMPNHYSSFHPKVWVIRYESKILAPRYRVLVTSRNLTFSRDWDVAYATDGEVTGNEQPKNRPLIHFLRYLNASGKQTIPDSFLDDLLSVKFDLPDKFDAFRFVPIGIPNLETGKQYVNPISVSGARWDGMLVVSPFLDKTTLTDICRSTEGTPFLLSRKEALDSLEKETLNAFSCWKFAEYFQEAEFYQELEDDGAPPVPQHLHAKLFVAMRGQVPYWYLGSANCTSPAQERNIEFMVELKASDRPGLKTKDIFRALTDPDKSDNVTLFTRYERAQEASEVDSENIESIIRVIKYELTTLSIKGVATPIKAGTAYDLFFEIDAGKLNLPEGFEVKVKPLPERNLAGEKIISREINTIDKFGGYAETALSPFLVFEIVKDRQVWSQFLQPMDIELPGSRLNKIFTAIIDSKEKFLKYLTFLLTGDETDLIKNSIPGVKEKAAAGEGGIWSTVGAPVYEKLLIAASRFPDKLNSVDKLIQRMKEETTGTDNPIISEEFESFWGVFKLFMENKH